MKIKKKLNLQQIYILSLKWCKTGCMWHVQTDPEFKWIWKLNSGFLIRSYGASNGTERCSVAQYHDKTWATLAQSEMGWYCQLLLIVLEIDGYKALPLRLIQTIYMWPGLRKSTMWAQITLSCIIANIFSSECGILFQQIWEESPLNSAVVTEILSC